MSYFESVGHILWGCESEKDVWCQGSRKIQKMHQSSESFMDIWLAFKELLSQEENKRQPTSQNSFGKGRMK